MPASAIARALATARRATPNDSDSCSECLPVTEPELDGVNWLGGGWLRQRNNIRDMTITLNRIKDVVEAG